MWKGQQALASLGCVWLLGWVDWGGPTYVKYCLDRWFGPSGAAHAKNQFRIFLVRLARQNWRNYAAREPVRLRRLSPNPPAGQAISKSRRAHRARPVTGLAR